MEENELGKRIAESEKEGFEELFNQYQNYVYSIVWRKIKNVGTKEDAEECLTDIFARVFLNFSEIEEGKLTAYISMISGRMAIDKYRNLCAVKNRSFENEEIPENLSSGDDIAKATEKAELSRILYEKIISLGEPDSTIIVQKYYYNFSSSEIAKQLNLTVPSVKMRLSRALKHLRRLLEDERTA